MRKNESPNGETGPRRRKSVIKTKMPHKHVAEITRELLQCTTCLTSKATGVTSNCKPHNIALISHMDVFSQRTNLSFILTQTASCLKDKPL